MLRSRWLSLPALLLGMVIAPAALAQADHSNSFSFAAVTIRPSAPGNQNSNLNFGQSSIATENVPLLSVIKEAYGLSTGSDDQVADAPAWVRSQRFDIVAKFDSPTAAALDKLPPEQAKQQQDLMLRDLLADRFQMKAHTVIKPLTVAALTVAGSGARLQAAVPGPPDQPSSHCAPNSWRGLHNDGHGHLEGKSATLAMLANILATQPDVGGRLVVDNTGLAGPYDFDLHYTPGNLPEENGPSLFTALTEQLGLKLSSRKLPVSVLVIDHIQAPSPN